MDEIIAEFINETRDMLDHVSGELVAWERDPTDRSKLDEIFRFVHTVKGSSGFLDLPRHQRLSHAAEDALGELRAGTREPSPKLVSAILAVIDRIGALTEALDSGDEIEADDEPLIAALHRSETETAPETPASDVSEAALSRGPVRSIRVPVELLDQLMAGVSDLVLSRNEFARRLASSDGGDLDLAFERLSASITDLRDRISWTRMQRIESLFGPLPRLVRDIANQLGKSVALEIDGSDVELDREMIEMLRDPLTHIIRNALDHGIEQPSQRARAGKPVEGRLSVSARQSGNRIEIAIADDGRGIDSDRLVAKAIEAGLIAADRAANLDAAERIDLIFHPGLSTAENVSEISGRGVGMDVVRTNVERLGGTIVVESSAGGGTLFRLSVPLTLTIMPALVIGCDGQTYAIPRPMIGEIVALGTDTAKVQPVADGELLAIRGERLPLVRLSALFGHPAEHERFAVIVTPRKGQRYALAVDEMRGHEDLVVKPLAPIVMETGLFAGTALPDTGTPVLLVDVAGIAAQAGLHLDRAEARSADRPAELQGSGGMQALIFDDLDGTRRAVRIGVVDRVIQADADSISESAGMTRLAIDAEILPVVASGPLPETGRVNLLRMTDGQTDIAYATAGPADAVTLDAPMEPSLAPGLIAGVVLHEGRPVEVIDTHFLFAGFAGAVRDTGASVCRILGGDDRWRREFLRPLVELAGYRVVFDAETTQDPVAVVIEAGTPADGDEVAGQSGNVLRLSERPGRRDTIFRYDRTGILAELQRHRLAGEAG